MDSFYPIAVKPLSKYRLLITFNNREQRIFDVCPYLSDDFFAPLKNPVLFREVRISPISITWPGDIDFCPDELYYNSIPVRS